MDKWTTMGGEEIIGNDLRELCNNSNIVWSGTMPSERPRLCEFGHSGLAVKVRRCQTVGINISLNGKQCADGRRADEPSAPSVAVATRAAQEATDRHMGRIRGDQMAACRNSGGINFHKTGMGQVCYCNAPKVFDSSLAACRSG
jgi:hypothetical protein